MTRYTFSMSFPGVRTAAINVGADTLSGLRALALSQLATRFAGIVDAGGTNDAYSTLQAKVVQAFADYTGAGNYVCEMPGTTVRINGPKTDVATCKGHCNCVVPPTAEQR